MKNAIARLEILPILFLVMAFLWFSVAPPATSASALTLPEQKLPLNETYPHLTVLASDNQHILLEFTPPKPEFNQVEIDGQICLLSKIAGLSESQDAGNPSLPVQGAMIGIPTDAQPTLHIHYTDQENIQLAYKLCPAARTSLDLADDSPDLVKTDYLWAASYLQDAYLPAEKVELVETGYLRGQRFVQIRFNPLQYLSLQDNLLFNKNVRVDIRFNSTESATRPLIDIFPTELEFEKNLGQLLLNHEQARNWRQVNTPLLPLKTTYVNDQSFFKVAVDQDGIYTIGYTDLQAAGAPVDLIDPTTIQLFNQSEEVSIQVTGQEDEIFDPGEEIIFYGQGSQSKYSKQNIYWLTWGASTGLRMQSIEATPTGLAGIPSSFLTTQHAEMDLLYSSSHFIGAEEDHWFWNRAYATSSTAFVEFQTELLNISPENQDVIIRGELKGYFANPNHHTLIYINDNLIGNYTFSSGADFSFEVVVASTYLVEGINTLKMECVIDDTITVNGIYLNWFEIDYLDTFMAESDQIAFPYNQAGTWEFRLDGFSSPDLEAYDLTEPKNPKIIQNFTIQSTANGQQLSFETTIGDEQQFWAQTTGKRLSPLSIVQDAPSNWKAPVHGADYIIITHADFSAQAEQLANFHSSRGLRVQVVDVQDIYDEFNGGILSPEAIHAFLKYAYANWLPPAPTYVLLMGDGHYDFRNNLGTSGPNFIPPYLDNVDSTVGETAVDNRYASVSGEDILPDLYIGRFPVRTPQEAATMVAKTINYAQQAPEDGWNANLLFVADDADAAGNFPVIADQVVNTYISHPYSAEKIYYKVNYADATSVRNGIVDAINSGKLMVHYNGHGAIPFWASPALFKVEDLPRLSNQEKLPFMLPMTCAEGYFIKPYSPTIDTSALGESIVRMSGGGAIASWSATGFGVTTGHVMLDQSLFTNIFENNQTNLGYLTAQAKYYMYAQTSLFNDMIETYTLFGDPALHLQVVPPEIFIEIYMPIMYKSSEDIISIQPASQK